MTWSNNFCEECGNISSSKSGARSVLVDAEKKGKKGEKESASKDELELVKHSRDVRLGGLLMHRAYFAGKSGDWEMYLEEFRKDEKHVRECCNEVEAEDEGRSSIAQDILRESKEFLRRIIAPKCGVGCVTLSYVCPHGHCLPLED